MIEQIIDYWWKINKVIVDELMFFYWSENKNINFSKSE